MKLEAIIIEAGQHTRSLDTKSSQPKSLDIEKFSNRAVLDWIIEALRANHISEITYIGNYHIEKVLQSFPHLNFLYYDVKDIKNEIEALQLYKNDQNRDLLIIRSDIIMLPGAIHFIQTTDITLCYATKEFTNENFALAYIPRKKSTSFFSALHNSGIQNLNDLTALKGVTTLQVDLGDQVAPVNKPHLLSNVIFQGKGKTLENIAPLLKKSIVLDQIRFTAEQWNIAQENIIKQIHKTYGSHEIVVRSNTISEDGKTSSQAGAFLSILHVSANDTAAVTNAINRVLQSYCKQNRELLPNDQILIQKQIKNVQSSGVLLTRIPQTGAPYFVLSIDNITGKTDTVTSGNIDQIENYYIARHCPLERLDGSLRAIIDATQEIIEISHNDTLDIEFCVDQKSNLYLLQVRPLIVNSTLKFSDNEYSSYLNELHIRLTEQLKPDPSLAGEHTLLGVMPDWNPAEMIGIHPRMLALSLYQRLITNQSWAIARSMIGYQSVTQPLMYALGGRPYIDVRASINSLLPQNLPDEIQAMFTDWCIKELAEKPFLHDKVEFELYVTAITPNWEKYKLRLLTSLNSNEKVDIFYQALHRLTNEIFCNFESTILIQTEKLSNLTKMLQFSIPPKTSVHIYSRQIRTLISGVIENGIIPFSIFARFAFISMQYLNDLVDLDVFGERVKNEFLNTIPTIASQFSLDQAKYQNNEISFDEMVQMYGHLRPNSYEITSENYKAHAADVFKKNENLFKKIEPANETHNTLSIYKSNIESILNDLNLNISYEKLMKFIVQSIQLREFAKFEFMKVLDRILITIAEWGSAVGLSKSELSHLHIDDLLRFEIDSVTSATIKHLQKTASFNQKKHSLEKAYVFPEVLSKPNNILYSKVEPWKANFVTLNKITGDVAYIEDVNTTLDLTNKIVCIESADPGFDWIFGHSILGLVTAFGGVASHMAIRAAEFNIPAAIGCGLNLFNTLKNAKYIDLNCEEKYIKVIT